jgi:FlaA1/EpsC-like NDP-sugar epimerase
VIARRVLVTGATGSIGQELVGSLEDLEVYPTDRDTMDVTDAVEVLEVIRDVEPELIFHLAGAKHAPMGEESPAEAAKINIVGTANVLVEAEAVGAKVVTASTCKACNPETAYGATKLIAERMTLNSGGSVARFFNVRESCGNVFETWRNLPDSQPIPVTPCSRRFMSVGDAVELLMWAAILDPGRYSLAGTVSRPMRDIAREAYPDRAQVHIAARRGDRLEEPEMASHEWASEVEEGVLRVFSPHDVAVEAAV